MKASMVFVLILLIRVVKSFLLVTKGDTFQVIWKCVLSIPACFVMLEVQLCCGEIGSILNALAGNFSEATRNKCKGVKTGTPHDWRSFYMAQYDWLKDSHMSKVVWLPNETDYSYCEFVVPDTPILLGHPVPRQDPIWACRLFFFFFLFFCLFVFLSAALSVAVCCEENNGLG